MHAFSNKTQSNDLFKKQKRHKIDKNRSRNAGTFMRGKKTDQKNSTDMEH